MEYFRTVINSVGDIHLQNFIHRRLRDERENLWHVKFSFRLFNVAASELVV